MKCIYCGEEFELKYTRGNALKRKSCYKEECEKKRKKENQDRFKAKMKEVEIEEEPSEEIEIDIEPNDIDIVPQEPKFEIKKVQELEITVNEIDYKDILDTAHLLDQCILKLRNFRAEAQKKETYYSNKQQDLLHKVEATDFNSVIENTYFVNDLRSTRRYRRICKNRHGLIVKLLTILNALNGNMSFRKKVETEIESYKKAYYRKRVQ